MRLSAEIKDGASSVILNLKEIRTSRHCEAALSIHGRNLSAFDFSMSCMCTDMSVLHILNIILPILGGILKLIF